MGGEAQTLKNIIRNVWGAIVWLFEKSDIIPPLIIVSAWHYSGALAGKDPALVAVILGVLIDLGHYRAVKSYLRALNGWRFAVMAIFTVMTGYYHYLWYQDYILAAGVPTLIIGLALLSKWDRWETQAAEFTVKVTKPRTAISASDAPQLPDAAERREYSEYAAEQAGKPVMPVAAMMAAYGIPERTAYRWRAKYQDAKKEG
jgi:hypothetical protein